MDKETGRILRKVCEPKYVFLVPLISVLKFLAVPSLFQIWWRHTHTQIKILEPAFKFHLYMLQVLLPSAVFSYVLYRRCLHYSGDTVRHCQAALL